MSLNFLPKSEVPVYLPTQLQYVYYRGTTFQLAGSFVNVVNGLSEPAQLNLAVPVSYQAEVRMTAFDKTPQLTITNTFFAIGKSDEAEPEFDELSIEAPAQLFEPLLDGRYLMDVFRYYTADGFNHRDCLLRIDLNVIRNITQKPFKV